MIRLTERGRRTRVLLALLLAASLALVTVDVRSSGDGPLDKLGSALSAAVGPLQGALASALRPVGNFFAGFGKVGGLREQIRQLERQNALYKQRELGVGDVVRENEQLRALLGMRDRLKLDFLAAEVIAVGPSNFEHSIVLDRGTGDGVRQGMPVAGAGGLVGRVVAVTATTARVMLVVDPSSAVSSRLASSGELGVCKGTGRNRLRFDLLDRGASVEVGDEVVTSGHEGSLYPPGIPIGIVDEVSGRPGLRRSVVVKPYVDFTSVDHVLVVTGGAAR
jgi:rod shape-determining protein MreC